MPSESDKPKLGKNLYWRGSVIWAKFKIRGELVRRSLLTSSPRIAEKRLQRERELAQDAIVYGDTGPIAWTKIVQEWTAWAPANLGSATAARYATSLLQIAEHLEQLSVQQITHDVLRSIVRARRRLVVNATIKRDLTAISSVLTFAEGEGYVEENVAHTFSRRNITERRDPIVLPDILHITTVILDCPPGLSHLARFALETGMRQEEVASLQWHQVDLQRRTIQLYTTKGKRARSVPLSRDALRTINKRTPFLRSPWVFWHDDGERYCNVAARFVAITSRVAQSKAQAGEDFRRFRFHDMRHYFAVDYLRRRTGSIYDLQKILGHRSIKTTEGYLDFLTPDERRAVEDEVPQFGRGHNSRHSGAGLQNADRAKAQE